ncbi:CT027 protein, partial [Calcarius ornatus]|nr:CT027 protein [Calcarius ornatus]
AGSKGKGTAVRFTPEGTQGHHQEGTQGHVHFQEQLHDSAVMVTQDKDGHFLVKVGFLKILHKYEITFVLPPVPSLGKDICPLPVPNPNLRIVSVTSLPEGTSLKPPSNPLKRAVPTLLPKKGQRAVPEPCPPLSPDRHHGTPMLLDGVRCMGAELEYDSEQSEWHGFD